MEHKEYTLGKSGMEAHGVPVHSTEFLKNDPNIILHQYDAEQRSDSSGKYGEPFGHGSDTHLMFEHRTEVNGWLSVNPQSFSKVNNGQVRIFDRSKYRYGTQRNCPK